MSDQIRDAIEQDLVSGIRRVTGDEGSTEGGTDGDSGQSDDSADGEAEQQPSPTPTPEGA